MKVTLMMCFNQSILQIYPNTHKSLGKGSGWIIYSVNDHTIIISKLYRITKRIKQSKKRLDQYFKR